MKSRDVNRRILLTFLLCTASVAAVTWTIGAKFIPDSRIAFFVSLGAALLIGALFERYLENILNTSADYLIAKIKRVTQGDLTQVFKEDPDDPLPYGLSFGLNEMIKSFRENIGKLRRTSSVLVKQLNQFTVLSAEVTRDFQAEVEVLPLLREGLQDIRNATAELIKRVTALQVTAASDLTTMGQVRGACHAATGDVGKVRVLLKEIQAGVARLRDATGHLADAAKGMSGLCDAAAAIKKSLSDLITQSNLVKLNAAIDATQAHGDSENYAKLVEEVKDVVDRIASLAQEAGGSLGMADGRIGDLAAQLGSNNGEILKGLEDLGRSMQILDAVNQRNVAAESGYGRVIERVEGLGELVAQLDGQLMQFSHSIQSSETGFDKLHSDTRITLLKYGELRSKIESMQDCLKTLEDFNRLFQIA